MDGSSSYGGDTSIGGYDGGGWKENSKAVNIIAILTLVMIFIVMLLSALSSSSLKNISKKEYLGKSGPTITSDDKDKLIKDLSSLEMMTTASAVIGGLSMLGLLVTLY